MIKKVLLWLARRWASRDAKSVAWLLQNDKNWSVTRYHATHTPTNLQLWIANGRRGLGIGTFQPLVMFGTVNPDEGHLPFWDRALIWDAYIKRGLAGKMSDLISNYAMENTTFSKE